MDNTGNLYVADEGASNIRKLTQVGTNWIVSTIGGSHSITTDQYGNPIGGSADGAGSAALFYNPQGIAVDSAGIIYVADYFNNTIRKGTFTAYAPANPSTAVQPGNGALSVTLLPGRRRPVAVWVGAELAREWDDCEQSGARQLSRAVQGRARLAGRPDDDQLHRGRARRRDDLSHQPVLSHHRHCGHQQRRHPHGHLATSPAQPPPGAGWHFLGDTSYYPSGLSTNVVAGTYQIGFAPVSGLFHTAQPLP